MRGGASLTPIMTVDTSRACVCSASRGRQDVNASEAGPVGVATHSRGGHAPNPPPSQESRGENRTETPGPRRPRPSCSDLTAPLNPPTLPLAIPEIWSRWQRGRTWPLHSPPHTGPPSWSAQGHPPHPPQGHYPQIPGDDGGAGPRGECATLGMNEPSSSSRGLICLDMPTRDSSSAGQASLAYRTT